MVPRGRFFEKREQRVFVGPDYYRLVDLVVSLLRLLCLLILLVVRLGAFSQSRLLTIRHERLSAMLMRRFILFRHRFIKRLSADITYGLVITLRSLIASRAAHILLAFGAFSLGRSSEVIYQRPINLGALYD